MVIADHARVERRYKLLDMVRQFGREKLEAAGEVDRINSRHRDYWLALWL